jgi:hypothetical protein
MPNGHLILLSGAPTLIVAPHFSAFVNHETSCRYDATIMVPVPLSVKISVSKALRVVPLRM